MRRPLLLAAAALLSLASPTLAQPRDSVPPDAWKDLPPAAAMVIGGDFMCTLDAEGAAWCWGANHAGQLGTRTREHCGIVSESGHRGCYPVERGTAARVDGGLRFTALAAGDYHACGLAQDGRAYCWGSDRVGQLGTSAGTTCLNKNPCGFVPREVQGDHRFRALYAFEEQTCGLSPEGALHCWGKGFGPTPAPVHPEMRFTTFAMGDWWCATATDGRSYCWGDDNRYGRLGTGGSEPSPTPRPIAGGLSFDALSIGEVHACGLTAEGRAYCWGLDGQEGAGALLGTRGRLEKCELYACSFAPHPVDGDTRFRAIDVAYDRTCALDLDGRAHCWGQDAHRQVGLGMAPAPDRCGHPLSPQPCVRVPTPVAGEHRFRTLSARQFHTCGVDGDGAVYCWGRVTRGVPARVPPTGHP
jgi:alpha-tubulin suppressor-like RCC1 family protein